MSGESRKSCGEIRKVAIEDRDHTAQLLNFRRLRKLAAAIDRVEDSLAIKAVESYLDLNEWQTNAIRHAVRMANRRNAKFVDHDEVDAWLTTWGTARESKRPR